MRHPVFVVAVALCACTPTDEGPARIDAMSGMPNESASDGSDDASQPESDDGSTGGAEPGGNDGDDDGPDDGGADDGDGGADDGDGAPGDDGGGGFPDPVASGCITSPAAGEQILTCGSISLTVVVPPQCLQAPCGIILDIHGSTMSADQEDANTNLRALGLEHGYIVIQPSIMGLTWGTDVDDLMVEFVGDALLAYHADPKRLHLTGFSAGGYSAWRMICSGAGMFASAAPAAAATYVGIPSPPPGCTFTGQQTPPTKIPLLYMHGSQDARVEFVYGEEQRDNIVAAWSMSGPTVVDSDPYYTHTRYESPEGVPFEFIEHAYTTDQQAFGFELVGHCYPGSDDHAPTLPGQLMGYGCKTPAAFHWGEKVIAFFEAHPHP